MSCSSRWYATDAARCAASLLAALALASGLAMAADAPDPAAPPDHIRNYFDARLAGEARLTWFGFHVYDARLFVPAGFDAADSASRPFALELIYARALQGKAIAETSRDEIARLGFGTKAQRERWFEQMLRIFPNVERGGRIAGVNMPGRGVFFYIDGRSAGAIDDADFARAFFAIWLDPRTRSPDVRADLLRDVARH